MPAVAVTMPALCGRPGPAVAPFWRCVSSHPAARWSGLRLCGQYSSQLPCKPWLSLQRSFQALCCCTAGLAEKLLAVTVSVWSSLLARHGSAAPASSACGSHHPSPTPSADQALPAAGQRSGQRLQEHRELQLLPTWRIGPERWAGLCGGRRAAAAGLQATTTSTTS